MNLTTSKISSSTSSRHMTSLASLATLLLLSAGCTVNSSGSEATLHANQIAFCEDLMAEQSRCTEILDEAGPDGQLSEQAQVEFESCMAEYEAAYNDCMNVDQSDFCDDIADGYAICDEILVAAENAPDEQTAEALLAEFELCLAEFDASYQACVGFDCDSLFEASVQGCEQILAASDTVEDPEEKEQLIREYEQCRQVVEDEYLQCLGTVPDAPHDGDCDGQGGDGSYDPNGDGSYDPNDDGSYDPNDDGSPLSSPNGSPDSTR